MRGFGWAAAGDWFQIVLCGKAALAFMVESQDKGRSGDCNGN